MKFSSVLPGFLGRKEAPISVDVSSVDDIQVVAPKPVTPFARLDDHLASLIAAETAAKAAYEKATFDLHEYMQELSAVVETHQASIKALYTLAPPQIVSLEKV